VARAVQINSRGMMTLPKPIRQKLGLDGGGVVMIEETSEGILLSPSVAFPVEMYSAARVAGIDAADAELAAHLERSAR